jgi:L-aspartate oxidase
VIQRSLGGGEAEPVLLPDDRFPRPLPLPPTAAPAPAPTLVGLQRLLWDRVGIRRTGPGLREAVATLRAWGGGATPPSDRPAHELANLVTTGTLMAEAALLREESRGAHFRTDFPTPSPAWRRHIVFQRE